MPIYSNTLSDESILRILRDKYHNILVIGCGACMNESLAYKYKLPIYNESPDIPYATVHELGRISELLSKNGYSVTTKYYNDINGFYCMADVSVDRYPIDWSEKPDIILLLSCNAGVDGLQDLLPSVNIVRITELIGGIPYGFNDKGNQRVMDEIETTILPIKQE